MSLDIELRQEFRQVLGGHNSFLDSLIPPVIFALLNTLWGVGAAVWGSMSVAALIMVLRLARRQSLLFSLGGLAAVALAILLVWLSGRAASFFLPGIVSGGLSLLLALFSVLAKRPHMAWTSHFARRWPLRWYWHPRVRPAYSETTWLWILYFAARLFVQAALLQSGSTGTLALAQLLTSWPATIVLLILTYLYGTWRLRHLGGPAVQEFRDGSPPPWQGQRRGF